jgi:hypothetical protein
MVGDQPLDLRSRQSARHGAGCRSLRCGAMRTMLGPADEERVRVAGIAAWSLVHGLATLILSGNLPEELAADPESLTRAVGGAAFGGARRNELASTTPGPTMAGSPSPPGGPATLSQDGTSR